MDTRCNKYAEVAAKELVSITWSGEKWRYSSAMRCSGCKSLNVAFNCSMEWLFNAWGIQGLKRDAFDEVFLWQY